MRERERNKEAINEEVVHINIREYTIKNCICTEFSNVRKFDF